MNLSDFEYAYPDELVAQRPLAERDASRLMVVDRATASWRHAQVSELGELLEPGDLLVLNDSRVIPARIFGTRGNGEALELLVVEPAPAEPGLWRCLLRRARRIRPGESIFFGMHARARACGRDGVYLLVAFPQGALELAMRYHGVPPLPPYIRREGIKAYTEEDRERYQTVYARDPGSAAAPTAGLHLSERLLARMGERGIGVSRVTLHVGIDTFAPVRAEELSQHRMHGERVGVPAETAAAVVAAKERGRRVIAVGTTSARALESAARDDGTLAHGSWVTDLFILPGYAFRVVDGLLTNFHQPRSTLLMMVAAFAGREFLLRCYEEAILQRYRLFSYGDAMLIR